MHFKTISRHLFHPTWVVLIAISACGAQVMSSTDGDDNDDDEEEVAKTASTIEATLLSTIANVMSSAR